MYQESDLVRIARRENNKKRNYLVVNPLQGKHIPVSPGRALDLFSGLAELLEEYRGERLLVVGFAETATAIGAQTAIALGAKYIQTTRENLEGVSYLFFSEEHSHAVEQKLVKEDMERIVPDVDRILFVEDEITTGKTILNGISALEKQFRGKMKFSVASLLNGMPEEAMDAYAGRGIGVHYLVKTRHDRYPALADKVENNGLYHVPDTAEAEYTARYDIGGRIDSRRGTDAAEYAAACGKLFDEISRMAPLGGRERILVLGTEEFMYPGLYVGKCLEEKGHFVRFHATTRSPIAVSTDSGYPLRERYELDSLYERGRKTYLYDIDTYDAVIVLTDAWREEKEGEASLLNALRQKNDAVSLVRWHD